MDFINNKNNPTGVTAAQAGTYTQQEILNMLATKADVAALPIAYWGQSLDFVVAPTITGTTLTFSQDIPVLIAGISQLMTQRTIAFANWNTLNYTTVYIYLEYVGGTVAYTTYGAWQNESASRIWLGSVTKSGGVWSFAAGNFSSVIMLGGMRLSKTKKGSAIPVSTGNPNTTGTYLW